MKRIFTFTIILMALTACTALQVQTPEPAATDIPQANMPNPASVYCEQNGNKLEIRTAADGSQNGICVFPDGSTVTSGPISGESVAPQHKKAQHLPSTVEATTKASGGNTEENASGGYMPPGTSEEIADWWGVIKSTEPGAQYDDYFERQDLGQIIYFGIDSMDPAVQVADRGTTRQRQDRSIFMAHYSAMCPTTTARRSRWTASKNKPQAVTCHPVPQKR